MALEDICLPAQESQISVSVSRGNIGTVVDFVTTKKDTVVEVPKSEANFSYG